MPIKKLIIISFAFVSLLLAISVIFYVFYPFDENGKYYYITDEHFETSDMKSSEINEKLKYYEIHCVDVNSQINTKSKISCFDVSSQGEIALGLNNNCILIYNNSNELKHVLTFNNNGNYYIRWKDNDLLIFIVKGEIIINVTQDGSFNSIIKSNENSINNNDLWIDLSRMKEKSIGGSTYLMSNNSSLFSHFVSTYSMFTINYADGSSTVLYDSN